MKHLTYLLIILIFISCDNEKTDSEDLRMEFIVNKVTVFEESNGSIDLTVSGGKKPYTYSWSNGSNTEDLLEITAGTYTITITDSENQTISDDILVEKINPLFSEIGSVEDIDGNIYKTVKIGNQWWMAENLRVNHNPQGESINSYSVNGNSSLDNSVGRLYDYTAVMNGNTQEGSQGIAPDGWHIPTDKEWEELYDFLGGMSIAGEKLKQYGTGIWDAPNLATNESGFTALPGGGYYIDVGSGEGYPWAVHYWSSTIVNGNRRLHSMMNDGKDAYIINNEPNFNTAISVRCIKD